jgi:hypothetical protein
MAAKQLHRRTLDGAQAIDMVCAGGFDQTRHEGKTQAEKLR